MKHKNILATISLSIVMSFASSSTYADTYDVTITNITKNIIFTPILVTSHDNSAGAKFFKPGDSANPGLELIAESGDSGLLKTHLESALGHISTGSTAGPLFPGHSVTVVVDAGESDDDYISMASMMLPTNDGFIALNGVKAPSDETPIMYRSPGYDAGTEVNDESCLNIPGPQCEEINGFEGEGHSAPNEATDEGYVHIHSGIHGAGKGNGVGNGVVDLPPEMYDWRNPVATISIQRVP